MATKLYTESGIWDWVWLGVPFFFIRDPRKFPSLIHSQKRNPQNNLRDSDIFWNWILENPESLHMILWMFSDYGLFSSYRHTNFYQGHAHKWTMKDGSFKYVHTFLQADAGYKFNTEDEAERLSGTNADFATQDLCSAIEKGDFPTWTAMVQVIDPNDVHKLGYNIFDMTKHWDTGLPGTYPNTLGFVEPRPFGKLTLNRNPQDYFTEIEQAAFSPANLVPGIAPTVDPLLRARLFAYGDAQRHRLGSSFESLEVNRSKNSHDNFMPKGSATRPDKIERHEDAAWEREMVQEDFFAPNENDLLFPRTFWTHLAGDTQYEGWQERLVLNLAKHLLPASSGTRSKVYMLLQKVDRDLGGRVKNQCEPELVTERIRGSSRL
jgi:catalase